MQGEQREPLPADKRTAMSLRLRVSLLILVPMSLILLLSSSISYYQQRSRSLSSMSLLASQTGNVIENALRRDMLLSDFDAIQDMLDTIAADERIRVLYLIDPAGRVVFAPGGEGVGLRLDNRSETCAPCHDLPAEERPSGILVEKAGQPPVFRSMHPIENRAECTRCHDPSQPVIGLLLTDLSISPIEAALTRDLRNNLLWWTGTLLLTGLVANMAVNRWVLRRLSDLARAIETFGKQGLRGKLPERPADEIGKLSAAFNKMAVEVERREAENAALSDQLEARAEEKGRLLRRLIRVQEDERKHLARELHDDFGQSLSSSSLMIENAERSILEDPQTSKAHLRQVKILIAEASERMYDLILGLRPSILDDLGLVAALRAHAQRPLTLEGIDLEFTAEGFDHRLPAEMETVMFRVLQEAITNIDRHAKARHVFLKLTRTPQAVEGLIRDDGVGFDPGSIRANDRSGRGLGLLGMRERAEQCGGVLEVISTPGQGTTVRIRIPTDWESE